MHSKRLTFPLALLLSFYCALAQDCADQLEQARTSYEEGRLVDIPSILESCSQNGSDEIRFGAHRILALTYLGLGQEKQARLSAVELLRISPTYKGNVFDDPKEFTDLLKSIAVIPRLTLGISASIGTNLSLPQVQSHYSLLEVDHRNYESGSGIQVGLNASYRFNRRLGVYADMLWLQKSYAIDYGMEALELRMEETSSYVQLPLGVRYGFPLLSRWQPYVQLGAFGSYLLESRSNHFSTDNRTQESYSVQAVSSTDRRKRWEMGMTAGIGTFYRIGPGQLTAQAGYNHSFTNITDPDTRYSNNEVTYSYLHVDDDLLLHQLYFTLGYNLFLNYKVVE